jgi:peptide/nickel transport system ATP-binding protein
MTETALAVDGLQVAISGVDVVDGVSFAVEVGETLAIVGESGCGKSMTALAIMRLLPAAAELVAGKVTLRGTELTTLSERAMRRVRGDAISMIFQEPVASLDPLMTVEGQLLETIRAHRKLGIAEARRLALEMLGLVGIPDPVARMKHYPFELSGGICQRIMIAIALSCEPAVLIADEPTTALDVTIQAQILELIKRMRGQFGTAVVLITHDLGVVADMADRVAVMYAGRVVEQTDVATVFAAPGHPYTALLLKSLPSLEASRKRELPVIQGSVPEPASWPGGCRFHPRCPFATAVCGEQAPPLAEVAPGQRVACWHHETVREAA